jgi:hypothetical protein
MKSYHELVMFLENSGVMRFTERGLSSYLSSAERMVKDAQARSGDFARMQDAQIAAVLGHLISHITRIVNTVPKDTDPKAVGIARKLLSLGGKAASVKKAFDDLSRSGAAIAARMTSELQGKYDMRFESYDGAHPYEIERDRITKETVAAAKARGSSRTQGEKLAKIEIERWKKAEGKHLYSDFTNRQFRAATDQEKRNEEREAQAKQEISRMFSDADRLLVAAGFKLERGPQGGSQSRYYTDGKIKVRISDHEVPMTAERQHNRTVSGRNPWFEFIFGERDRAGVLRVNPKELQHLRDWIGDLKEMRSESHDPKHIDETAYGVFSNYLGSSMMSFVQTKQHELDRRTDKLTKALARVHAQGAAGVQRDLGLPFAQVSLDGVEFRPHRGGVRKLLVRFNPNGTLGINADGKTVANSAALRDIGPLMAKIVGGGFA